MLALSMHALDQFNERGSASGDEVPRTPTTYRAYPWNHVVLTTTSMQITDQNQNVNV